MDVEKNVQPGPNGFTQSATHDVLLTAPNRGVVAVPFASPSQLAIVEPVSSSLPESFGSHISLAGSQASTRAAEPDIIAAPAVVADSKPQPPSKTQRPITLSLLPPLPAHLSGHSSAYATPQLLVSSFQGSDVTSSNGLSDGVDTPSERRMSHPACLTPGLPSYRPAAQHLSSLPPLPTKFSIEGVSARLSPAIITRQPPHPILSLPPISSTSSPAIEPRRLRSQSLRSVPALPMEGSEDLDPAEHDNAMLDDLDEEEGIVDEEEEEGNEHPDTTSEEGESASNPPSPLIPQPSLPNDLIDVTPLDMSFLDGKTSGTHRRDDKTPKNSRMTDYFTSNLPEPGTSRTPLPSSQFPAAWTSAPTSPVPPTPTSPSMLAAAWATSAPRAMPTPTTPTFNARTNMYHQASCSMIDMSEILRKEQRTPEVSAKAPKTPVGSPAPDADSVAAAVTPDEPGTELGPSLRRRLSMPTFGPSSAPPPYPQFYYGERGPAIQPRDDEGREHLPHYTNDIYLRAIMPRKMEFTAPGVQARDRKWRRTLCVLEGTSFRVYKCPSAATGKSLLGNLWEKTVGVGDIATTPQIGATSSDAKKARERDARLAKLERGDGTPVQSPPSPPSPSPGMSSQTETEQEAQSTSSTPRSRLLPPNLRRKNRSGSDGPSVSRIENDTRRSSASLRQSSLDSGSAHGSSLAASASCPIPSRTTETTSPALAMPRSGTPRSPRVKRRHLWVDDPSVPFPQPQDLLYSYSLNNAESGLGSDYVKRRNVIRIRMEGQQFLLQARDIPSVVDWIEVRLPFLRCEH
jgi:hypothetical protein